MKQNMMIGFVCRLAQALTGSRLCVALLCFYQIQTAQVADAQPLPSSAASIAQTRDPHTYLIANYSDVFALDTQTGQVERLELLGGSRPNVPTGLAYDAVRDRFFIANYRSNNVLVARLDLGRRALIVEQEIATDVAISPENVAIDPETGDLAIANYDGNDVQVWSQANGNWQKRCSAAVGLAHGVAFADGAMWATSLERRELLRLRAGDCSVVARTGRIGWGDGEFLWPTAVMPWGEGRVVVSDAHTGRLQVFGTRELEFQSAFGGNGPFLLNMPYGFLPTPSGGFLVLSTFGYEAVEFDAAGRVVRRHGSQDAGWSMVGSLNVARWAGYRRADRTRRFLDLCVHESYARLLVCEGGRSLRAPGVDQTYLSGGAYFYFLQVAELPGGWLFSSPQNPLLLHFRRQDLRVTVLPVGVDAWQVDGVVTSPAGEIRFADVDATATRQWPGSSPHALTLQQAAGLLSSQLDRVGDGWAAALDTARHALRLPAEVIAGELAAALAGQTGFVAATEACANGECQATRLCEISRGAVAALLSKGDVNLATIAAAAIINPCFGTELVSALKTASPTAPRAGDGVLRPVTDVRAAWTAAALTVVFAAGLLTMILRRRRATR